MLSLARHAVGPSYHAHASVLSRQAQYFARLALDPQTRRDAYRLRYDSYLASGFIEQNETRQFRDIYDDLPNCETIVLYDQAGPVASVRTCSLAFGSRQRSPAMDTYPEQVTALLRAQAATGLGGRGIETTRLVRSPAAENNHGPRFPAVQTGGLHRDDGPHTGAAGVCAAEPCTVLPATGLRTDDGAAPLPGSQLPHAAHVLHPPAL